MKRRNLVLTLTCAITIAVLASCKKYEDGPALSLRTRKERVANTWRVENYKVNGSDFTSLVSDYTETFTEEYNYSYEWGLLDGSGTWVFQNNDEELNLTGTDDQTSRILVIEKLEEETFWYYYMDGNDKHELHLVQK